MKSWKVYELQLEKKKKRETQYFLDNIKEPNICVTAIPERRMEIFTK